MPDILQDLPIRVAPQRVFDAVTQPALLDQWWTVRSSGRPTPGTTYELDFGPSFLWRAVVERSEPGIAFEWRMTEADDDWTGTRVGFDLAPIASGTLVRFAHRHWPEANAHYRGSSHCWALYLRVLRRHLEFGEVVPYDQRLDV